MNDFHIRKHGIKQALSHLVYEKFFPGDYYSLSTFYYYKCIFIHIPKTAGISISRSLFGNLAGGHLGVMDYKIVFGEYFFDKYYKFSIVRHPYTRIRSAYYFLKNGGVNEKDANWAQNNLHYITSFQEFIIDFLDESILSGFTHFFPQHTFILDETGMSCVDYIGKFEALESSFSQIKSKIGLKNKKLLLLNKSDFYPIDVGVSSFDLQKMHSKVHSLYRKDYELFGYQISS